MVLRCLATGPEAIEEVSTCLCLPAWPSAGGADRGMGLTPALPACQPAQLPAGLPAYLPACLPALGAQRWMTKMDGIDPSPPACLPAYLSALGTRTKVDCTDASPPACLPASPPLACTQVDGIDAVEAIQFGAAPPELQRMAAALVDKYYGAEKEVA